jgi:chaperonin cofactor prefoldin
MDKSRTIERSSYKTIGNLMLKMEKDNLIERKLNDKGHPEVKPIPKP